MFRLGFKILLGLFISFILLVGILLLFYTKGLPFLFSNEKAVSYIEKTAKKYTDINLELDKTYLKTGFSKTIEIKAGRIYAEKSSAKLFEVTNLDLLLSLDELFKKKIIVNRFGADKLYVDVNPIMELVPQTETKQSQPMDWNIDLYDSILYLNNSNITYKLDNGTKIDIKADGLNVDNTQKVERFVHFNFDADVIRNNNTVKISFKDDNKIVIKNKHIYVNDCPLTINHSKMFFDAEAGQDNNFEVVVYAKRFFLSDVIKLLQTNIVENEIDFVLETLKNINGDFDFRVKLTNNDLSGNVKVNKVSANLFPLANMPIMLTSGDVYIKQNDIFLTNFKGFYDNKKYNEVTFEGSVKDYLKTLDTNIEMLATVTNDFVGNYLSKTAMVPLTLIGNSKAKILIHSKNQDVDVTMMGKIAKGDDILVDGASLSPTGYDRALKADLHVKGDNLNIETINYYIAQELTKASKGIKPILSLNGNVRISDAKVKDFGFEIPRPLPSEFLNVLIGQKLFKGGKFAGNMHYIDEGEYPVINAKLTAEKIRIPSQRLFLKNGEISTTDNLIKIKADGRFRRCSYIFNGNILNAIKLPIIIKHTDLTVDNVDIERLMKAFSQPVQTVDTTKDYDENNDTDDNPALTFDIGNLIIEESLIHIIKGSYKVVNFADVKANMSLDKNSIFKLKSNRFEIAEGHSSADVNCDLKNQKYNLRLGIKDVNVDLMSTAILNLPKEITGKASGLIDLNTDESLKLNGAIKFIVKDGTIEKIGLVEYVLKFASLFRNPLAMISPSIFTDLVNIPEGKFEKITGDLKLKDNRIELMKIKSYSPTLSAYIVGCYNLENSDAILRIYTKFSNKNKGVAGVLRNISLNSLANRIPLNSRNDANYYEAELSQIPDIEADEKDCQIFLTKVDGDVEHNNFISSLKKIK